MDATPPGIKLPAPFDTFLRFVFQQEGGFVDHPSDPGGATKHGISLRYAEGKGRLLDLDLDGDVDAADIRLITPEVAGQLYRTDFWDRVLADALPPALAIATADAAVNAGPGRAIPWLQTAVGAKPDGVIGPRTLASAAAASPSAALAEMVAQRMLFHARSANFGVFGGGWTRRTVKIGVLCAPYLPSPFVETLAS